MNTEQNDEATAEEAGDAEDSSAPVADPAAIPSNRAKKRELEKQQSKEFAKSIKDEMNKKIPKDWVVDEAKKKVGARYKDPNNKGNSVRVDQGNPDSSNPSQQVDHVVVNSGGKIIGRYGDPLNVPLKDDPLNGHIPLSEYNNWGSWNHP